MAIIFKIKIIGPPAKSWSLPTELTITFLRDLLYRSSKITVEDIQRLSTNKSTPIPSSIRSRRFKVPNSYRAHAGKILSNIFSPLEKHQIGWDWQHNRDKTELKGEWLQEKGNPLDPRKENTLLYLHGGAYYIGCYGIYRQFLSRFISVAIYKIEQLLTPCLILSFASSIQKEEHVQLTTGSRHKAHSPLLLKMHWPLIYT